MTTPSIPTDEAVKLAETVLRHLEEIQELHDRYSSTYRHDLTESLREILNAGHDYERRKYMS